MPVSRSPFSNTEPPQPPQKPVSWSMAPTASPAPPTGNATVGMQSTSKEKPKSSLSEEIANLDAATQTAINRIYASPKMSDKQKDNYVQQIIKIQKQSKPFEGEASLGGFRDSRP